MDKLAVRQVLEEMAAFLELKGENPFRIRAYENAARAVASIPGDLADAFESGTLAEVRGIGKGTLEIVGELLSTGRASALDELREQIPPGLVEMLRIPGLGVTKIRQIHEALHIESIPELEAAAGDGRLAELPGSAPRPRRTFSRASASCAEATSSASCTMPWTRRSRCNGVSRRSMA